MIRKKEKTS